MNIFKIRTKRLLIHHMVKKFKCIILFGKKD